MSDATYAELTSMATEVDANPTVEALRPVPGTNPWGIVDWFARDIELREARQHNRGHAVQLETKHRDVYRAAFFDGTRDALKRSVRDILEDLAVDFGLAWVDLAKMVGVSVPAIRKWRLEGGISPENHRRIAEVRAFLSVLQAHARVADPVSWISQRMLDGYTVTVRHLYSPERVGMLLDYAAGGANAVQVLDGAEPDWREKYGTSDEVVPFDDGGLAIVRRR